MKLKELRGANASVCAGMPYRVEVDERRIRSLAKESRPNEPSLKGDFGASRLTDLDNQSIKSLKRMGNLKGPMVIGEGYVTALDKAILYSLSHLLKPQKNENKAKVN